MNKKAPASNANIFIPLSFILLEKKRLNLVRLKKRFHLKIVVQHTMLSNLVKI